MAGLLRSNLFVFRKTAITEKRHPEAVKCYLSGSAAATTRPIRSAVIGVQVGNAATETDKAEVYGVIESHWVVAVIAVVACNACNARIAYNARNAARPGCVQRRNDVANCHWSVITGDWSVVRCHWLSLHARMQRRQVLSGEATSSRSERATFSGDFFRGGCAIAPGPAWAGFADPTGQGAETDGFQHRSTAPS